MAVAVSSTRVVDVLLLATVFAITFAKVRWTVGGADVNISDVTAGLFLVALALSRVDRRDASLPRSSWTLLVFFALFVSVYLAGFFNLETIEDRDLFVKGIIKFSIHFLFLVAAVAHLSRRGPAFYWRTLGWFTAGIVVELRLRRAPAGRCAGWPQPRRDGSLGDRRHTSAVASTCTARSGARTSIASTP